MIFLAFYLGGLVVSLFSTFTTEFQRSNSVKELWNSMRSIIITSLLWPIALPIGIYYVCFRDPNKNQEVVMTNEDKFHQEVLKSLNHWSNELISKSKEDFDSLNDYGDWIDECVIDIAEAINSSRYEYYKKIGFLDLCRKHTPDEDIFKSILRDELDETVSNLRRNANE